MVHNKPHSGLITSHHAFDLENATAGGSHIEGFPITKHDRGRSTVTAESNEEKKNVG